MKTNHISKLVMALALGLGMVSWWSNAALAQTADTVSTRDGELTIRPINHATLALLWKGQAIYVDPVGGAKAFAGLPEPDLIVLTDIHGDHLNKETLAAVIKDKTKLVAPPAAAEQLPEAMRSKTTVMRNGETQTVAGIKIEAIAAYNLAPERQKFHAKGRGNGYVLNLGDKRVYLSGDTEDIPEMRALKEIDVAFLCMNLPYTMTPEQAADAVKAFKPKVVYPYHCRGSDLNKFRQLLADVSGVEVRLRDWYNSAAK